jgi:hypothetical protein
MVPFVFAVRLINNPFSFTNRASFRTRRVEAIWIMEWQQLDTVPLMVVTIISKSATAG